jgi:hypothetical protein
MEEEQLIPVEEFCIHSQVEQSFITSLQEYGLIEVVTIEEKYFIHPGKLGELERISRLHYELDINLEGIEAIIHLLNRTKSLQQEITLLKNKLRMYESE